MPDPDVVNVIVTLRSSGWSQRRIAREVGVSRNTVRSVLGQVQASREEGHSALPSAPKRRGSMLDEHADFIRERLDNYPDLSAVRVHEDLVERGFEGSYEIVKERVRQLRPKPKKQPSRAMERPPGKYGQQDWSPYRLKFTRAPEQVVECFSLALAFSCRQYIDFCEHKDFHTFTRQHVRAFERFERVPREILYDRQKVVVLGRECGRDLYNPRFLAFASYYGFRPRVLPPRSPKLKPLVEQAFKYVEGNCLAGREFCDLEHLRRHAAWWMDNRSDVHEHSRTREPPLARFARERDDLLPLPAHPYDTAEIGYRVVDIYGFVVWETTRYSVPFDHVLDIVVLRVTESTLMVYDDSLRTIATHDRRPRGHTEPVVAPGHHPRKPKRDIGLLMKRIEVFGEVGLEFAAGVARSQRYRGVHLGKVLALQERYDLDDIKAALERAVRYHAYDAGAVARILEHTAVIRVLPDSIHRANRRLRGVLGTHQPRSLETYADALRPPKGGRS